MKKSLIIILTLSLVSCKIQGLTNDFDKLTIEQKKMVIDLDNFENLKNDYIYKINGKQLREELKEHPKSIVYIFKNGCTSKMCEPMMIYENYAKNNGYKLFLVMDGYANLSETLNQPYSSILFSINNEYYKSKYRNTYSRYFENEISKKPLDYRSKEYLGNLFFFENDNLVKVLNELPK